MILIVGLGNPEKKYAQTRHNIGFRIVDEMQKHYSSASWEHKEKFYADLCRLSPSLLLVKPQTGMNRSGASVSALAAFHRVPVSNIFVLHDDVDLDFGTLRIRNGGSFGGHRGVESLILKLGENAFPRFRFGVGPKRPAAIPAEHFILKNFTAQEEKALQEFLPKAAERVLEHKKNPQETTIHLGE